jgi:hypothetical protein
MGEHRFFRLILSSAAEPSLVLGHFVGVVRSVVVLGLFLHSPCTLIG